MRENIGEGIAIIGIMIAVGLTKNYWLLLFTILPILTWTYIDKKLRDKANGYEWKIKELEIEKSQEEVRLLKEKKR